MKRIGIIGGGAISSVHIEGLRAAGAEVIAVADSNPKALEARRREFSLAETYSSAEEMLARSRIDAATVCTPNFLHAKHAMAALEAGRDVLCEKPPATNRRDAKAMWAAAQRAGRLLMMGFNHRFAPEAQQVNRLREEGYFGEIYHAKARYIRRRGIPGLGGWFTTKAMAGGGPVYDLGVHVLDRTWYMMGRPRPVSVSAKAYCKFGRPIADYVCTGMWAGPRRLDGTMDVEDFASAFIRFEGGRTMTLEASWAVNRDDEGVESLLLGDRAGARFAGKDDLKIFTQDRGMIVDVVPKFDKTVFPDRFRHFVDCLEGRCECTCTGTDGVVIQAILDAIYESSEADREVPVDA
jgi:predicted dehydrogenase